MSDLDQIATVNITADSKTVSRTGFGTPLLLCHHSAWTDKYRIYSSMDEVDNDFPDSFSTGYLMASAAFAQDPAPTQVVIGRVPPGTTNTQITVNAGVVAPNVVSFTVVDPVTLAEHDFSYTLTGIQTATDAATQLTSAIEGTAVLSGNVIATSAGAVITIAPATGSAKVWVFAFKLCSATTSAYPHFQRQLTITSATQGDVVKVALVSPTTGAVNLIDYTVPPSQTTTQVATSVALLIDAFAGLSAVSTGAVITVESRVQAGNVWLYDLQNCTVEETTADLSYPTTLSAIEAVYDDWYFVNIDSSSPANIAAVGTWVTTRDKLFFPSTDSSGEKAGTGTIGFNLKAASNNRTVLLYSANPAQFNGVRWSVVGGTQDPGSITYKYKTLIGGSASVLTSTERTNLDTDNVNYLQALRGISWAGPGKAAGGEWIDIMHGIDAVKARVQEAVYALFLNSAKVPHSEKGYEAIASVILGVLALFEGTPDAPGFLVAGTSKVILPAPATITSTDRKTRQLRNVRFSADLEGAVHFVSIRGTLSV